MTEIELLETLIERVEELTALVELVGKAAAGGIWWLCGCMAWSLILRAKNDKHMW